MTPGGDYRLAVIAGDDLRARFRTQSDVAAMPGIGGGQ